MLKGLTGSIPAAGADRAGSPTVLDGAFDFSADQLNEMRLIKQKIKTRATGKCLRTFIGFLPFDF